MNEAQILAGFIDIDKSKNGTIEWDEFKCFIGKFFGGEGDEVGVAEEDA